MSEQIDIIRKLINRKVLLHTVFWTSMLLIVFVYENWAKPSNFNWPFFIQYVVAFCVFVTVSYINLYVIVPRYFKSKRYLYYAISLILLVFIAAVSIVLLKHAMNRIIGINPEFSDEHDHSNLLYFFHVLFAQSMFLIATTFFYILEEWIRLQNITIQLKETESEKINSELQALKAQINPHFLFNTLNNIYSHSLDKSPKAPEMILKLSDLMSYILYGCHDEMVPISNELDFIQNYIDLEKMRFEDQLDVIVSIHNSAPERKIVPLLFIPFVENAFKHGGNTGETKKGINLSIDIDESCVFFTITNTVDPLQISQKVKESGIGIENVRKRLELLYPTHHKLEITNDGRFFTVQLSIN